MIELISVPRVAKIQCICGGHEIDIVLNEGDARPRCPMRGYFSVVVRRDSPFAWNLKIHYPGGKVEEQNRFFLP